MGKDSKISWTNHTFNPWWGCSPVSAGCDHCYALTWAKRVGQNCFGDSPRRFFDAHWDEPLKWDRAAQQAGERHRVFVASMGDVFEDRRDLDELRSRLIEMIERAFNLDFLLLTKRPESIMGLVPDEWQLRGWPQNIWLGVTAENQETANQRIPILLEIPAKVRFVSVEPMLGPISFGDTTPGNSHWLIGWRRSPFYGELYRLKGKIDWVICGGESGPKARPMNPDWVRSLRDQCVSAGTPFFFKQWGGRSKDATLDGREWRQFPGDKS